MRKTETIVRKDDAAKEVILTFRRLTMNQEDKYSDWLRKLILKRAREALQATCPSSVWPEALAKIAKELCGSACSLTGVEGITNACTGDGMKKFLMLAAEEDYPGIDEEAIGEIMAEDFQACVKVVQSLLPLGMKELEDPK